MKTIQLFISILFIGNIALNAQPTRIEIRTKKDYLLKGDVKQVVDNSRGHILKFTSEGNLQFAGFLRDGKLDGDTYTYDKAGHLLKYNYWGNSAYVYTYNAKGQVIKEQKMNGAECISSSSFLYDTYGNARQETKERGLVYTLKNTYDSRKRLIKIECLLQPINILKYTTNITYLPNGWTRYVTREKSSKVVKEYDSKGRKRSLIIYDESGNISVKSTTSYDDNGNLIEEKEGRVSATYVYNDQGEQISQESTNPDGLKSKTNYRYIKHDVVGNWIERVVDSDGEQTTETRTITYYENANVPSTTNDPVDAFFGKGNFNIPNSGEFVTNAPSTVAVGEQFRLNYTIGFANADNFKAPSLPNFNVLMGPSRSQATSTEVTNGSKVSTKTSITYTFILQAEKEGSFTIPGATVESEGKTYTSNAVTIKVTSK